MKVLELHNILRRYGLSVRNHYLIEGGYKVGKIKTSRGGHVEEISAIPEIDDKIANAVLGME